MNRKFYLNTRYGLFGKSQGTQQMSDEQQPRRGYAIEPAKTTPRRWKYRPFTHSIIAFCDLDEAAVDVHMHVADTMEPDDWSDNQRLTADHAEFESADFLDNPKEWMLGFIYNKYPGLNMLMNEWYGEHLLECHEKTYLATE